MCEFCVKHGEGKKWYLNAKNYSDDLLSDITRKKFIRKHFYWLDEMYKKYFNFFKTLPLNTSIVGASIKSLIRRAFIYKHWGQVIPIEDVEKILSFTSTITRVPCGCRMTTTGKEYRVCFLISMSPDKIGIADVVDQSFFGGPDVAKFERVSAEDTVKFFKESESKGMIHTIWAFKAPFIGGFCNCDSTGCIPMKMYKDVTPFVFRAEYIAKVKVEDCAGCKECIKICQFGAMEFDENLKRAIVNPIKCFGCGICRSVCKKDAIGLIDRKFSPEAKKLW